MFRYLLAVILILVTSQAFGAAALVPAFGTIADQAGNSASAGQTGSNTLNVFGATVGKVGGKAALIVSPGHVIDVRYPGPSVAAAVAGEPDSKAKIQAILNYAHTKGNGDAVVYIPSGTWNLSSSITIPIGVTLIGDGCNSSGATLLNFTSNSADGVILANDGSYHSYNGIKNLRIQGARYGANASNCGYITIENVRIESCTVGYYALNTLNSHYRQLDCSRNGTGAIIDFSGVRGSDQSTWETCFFSNNTGPGLVKHRGQGNIFIACQAVSNGQQALIFDEQQTSTNPLLTGYMKGNDTFIDCYIEDNPNTDTGYPLISATGVWHLEFINAVIWNYHAKSSTGIINLSKTGGFKMSGVLNDTGNAPNVVVQDRFCLETDVELHGTAKVKATSRLLGRSIDNWSFVYPSSATVLQNSNFGSLTGWTQSGATSQLSLDTSDLLFPSGVTGSSLKITQATPAATVTVSQNTGSALTAGGTYYLNIIYKNDNGYSRNQAPLYLWMQNVTGGYAGYDFATDAWSGSGTTNLQLPISSTPYAMSIPFTAPASSSTVVAILTATNFSGSGVADGAIYHVYHYSISTRPLASVPKDTAEIVGAGGPVTNTYSGTASTPAHWFSGSPFTGGSGSTTWPLFLLAPSGVLSSNWNTGGTFWGINVPSGFTGNIVDIQVNGSSKANIDASGNIISQTAVKAPSVNANQINSYSGSLATITFAGQTNTATSGSVIPVRITPTYNQASGNAANTDFQINRTETAVGSGTQRLLSAGTGGASYVEKFGVDNAGKVNAGGGSANKAMCWKSDGKTLGYCSTQPDSTGACTCN